MNKLAGMLALAPFVLLVGAVPSTKTDEISARGALIAGTIQEFRLILDALGEFEKDDNQRFLEKVKRASHGLCGAERYYSMGFQRGMRILLRANDATFEHPFILTATIWRAGGDIDLKMFWLSSTENVAQIYVETASGKTLAMGDIFTTEGKDEDEASFLQQGRVRIAGYGMDQSIPMLQIDVEELAQDLRVGLIEKDGRRTKSIQAFIGGKKEKITERPEKRDR